MTDCMIQPRPTDTFPQSHERILAEVNVGDPQAVDPSSYPSMLPKDLHCIDSESGHHRDVYAATRESSSLEALVTSLRTAITTCEKNKRRRSRLLYELGCALVEQSKGSNAESYSVVSEAINSFQGALSFNGIPESLSCRTPIVNCLIDATSMTLGLSWHQPSVPQDHDERPIERILADINVSDPQAPDPSPYPLMLLRDLNYIDCESGRHRDAFAASRDPSTLEALITSLRSVINNYEKDGKRRSRLLYELGCALVERFKVLNAASALSEAIDTFQEALSFTGIPDSLPNRTPVVISLIVATSMALEASSPSQDHNDEGSKMEDSEEAFAQRLAVLGIHSRADSHRRFSRPGGLLVLHALQSLCDRESDLNETISHLRSATYVCQHIVDVETCSLLFAELGMSLYKRFEETKNVDALDESIAMSRKALNLRSFGNQARLVSHFCASKTYRMHMQADGFTDSFFWRLWLGFALKDRFNLRGEASDLDELIKCWRLLIDICPDKTGNMFRSELYSKLAESFRWRFDRTGNCEALDEAIEMIRKASDLRSMEDQNHLTSLQRLWDDSDKGVEAQDLTRSVTERNEIADNGVLKESIGAHRKPSKFQPSSVKSHVYLLRCHASCLVKRFEVRKHAQDLTDAIRFYNEALDALPTDDPKRCAILVDLLETHVARYAVDRDEQGLNEATALLKLAEDTCPIDSEHRAGVCAFKAMVLISRYELHPDEKYLDEAISPLEQVLDTLPPTYQNRHIALQRLSLCLERKFRSSGDVTYLDKALHHAREFVRHLSSNVAMRHAGLEHIAGLLLMRYEQTGNERDLDDAIAIQSECLQLMLSGHPDRHGILTNLGLAKTRKYELSRDVRDLDEAVDLFRKALRSCIKSNVTRGKVLGNLAVALGHVYRRSKSLADLDKSIITYKEALGLYPPNHGWRLSDLLNYAMLCKDGYFEHGRNGDLQEALDRFREVESSLPKYDPRQLNVRIGIAELYVHGQNQTDGISEALSMFRSAVHHATASVELRFIAAVKWADSARELRHRSIIEAYGHAMNLLERRLLTNPTAELQHRVLAHLPKSFASDAAANVIEVGDVETAIELLEQGRGLLWTQLSRYKHPLDALGKAKPELAEKFRTVSRRLEQLALSSNREASSTQVGFQVHTLLDKQMEDLHSLSKEWEEIVEQIRTLNGFSEFLRAVSFAKLQKAAADGPAIVVNVSEYRCDAIIIRDGESPVVVSLPQLTEEKMQAAYISLMECLENLHTRNSRFDLMELWNKIALLIQRWLGSENKQSDTGQKFSPCEGIKHVLRYLWKAIVSPVITKLEELSIEHHSRIWWCPTSVLCHLPLHAAGPYEDGKPDLPDLYVSSYLVTLSRFDAAKRAHIDPELPEEISLKPTMLVIACPGQEGAFDFLYSIEKEVAEIVCAWMSGSKSPLSLLWGEDASYGTVLSQLPHHPWVHFSCHGVQHPKPFESSFKLQDGRSLTLIDLMRARVENAELAFLSACNTATGDIGGTPDEGLHLAAAMQYCGFRSVVGTLWPMVDDDGPDVARDFYGYLLDEGKGDYKLSAAALHHAVLRMRERNVPIDRWINFVHYGA